MRFFAFALYSQEQECLKTAVLVPRVLRQWLIASTNINQNQAKSTAAPSSTLHSNGVPIPPLPETVSHFETSLEDVLGSEASSEGDAAYLAALVVEVPSR